MRRRSKFGFLCATVLVFGGCTSTNVAEIVKALANDNATVCIAGQWGGGLVNIARTNIVNGDVQCPPTGGLTVRSPQAGQTTVPVQLEVVPAK